MKNEIRVVVVDDNEALLKGVKDYLSHQDRIRIVAEFRDGYEAQEYLLNKTNLYDIVLLDVILARYDGLKIMESMHNNNINKSVIILSSFKDEFTIKRAQELGAKYYMLKPIDMEIIEERIISLYDHGIDERVETSSSIETGISNLLHDLGVPSHIKGYVYLREGIMYLYTQDSTIKLVTKNVYPEIARKFETTPSRVERAIRHAIEISWARGDMDLMDEIFGNSLDNGKDKPTNAEYLLTIADKFKLSEKIMIS